MAPQVGEARHQRAVLPVGVVDMFSSRAFGGWRRFSATVNLGDRSVGFGAGAAYAARLGPEDEAQFIFRRIDDASVP